jgi:hypothetical protein
MAFYVANTYLPALRARQRASTFFATLFVIKLRRIVTGRRGRALWTRMGLSYRDSDTGDAISEFSDNDRGAITRHMLWPAAAAALLPETMQETIHRWGNLITD